MAERAAYLVDEVLPRVPVRQWVLTLPYRLRYRLAWDHALCRAVLGVSARVRLAFYARTARSHGIQDGRTGTVTVIQRFGSGLQLNIHMHTLVLDGVFSEARPRPLTFHPSPPPSDEDVAQVLAAVRARVGRLLAHRQLEPADDTAPPDPLAEVSPVLAGLVGASVQGRRRAGATGRRPRPPPRRRAGPRARHLARPASGPARRLRPPRQRPGPPTRSRPPRAALSLSPPPPARPGPPPPPRRWTRPRRAQDGVTRWNVALPLRAHRILGEAAGPHSPARGQLALVSRASSPRVRAGARRSSTTAAQRST
jgi:hypothetical protein